MKTEEIRDLMRFLKRYYSDEHPALDLLNLHNDPSNYGEFFRNLVSTPSKKDEEIAKKIYKDTYPKTRYKKLKSTFTSRALNTITFLDIESSKLSGLMKAIYRSYKNLFFISTLLRLGSRGAAISLARKTLVLSERYELHHVSVELLEQLRTHAMLNGQKTDFKKYAKGLEYAMGALESESKVRTLVQEMEIHSAKSTYIDEKLATKAYAVLEIIKAELNKHDTYLNRLSLFRLQNMYSQYAGSPSESIKACNAALAYLLIKPHMTPDSRTGEFLLYKLENYMLLQDDDHATEQILECAAYISEGTNLWFNFREFHFLLLMHTENFQDADRIYFQVTNHDRFAAQSDHIRERWDISKLYLDYFRSSEKRMAAIGALKRSYLLRQSRYAERVKIFPTYTKDKRGMNVAMLMLNILLLLEGNKNDLVLAQAEALKTYRFTHLKPTNSHQSAILFRLVKLMVKYEFQYDIIIKKAKSLEEQLRNTKPSIGELKEAVLIMPPMLMWQRMKAALEANLS